MYNKFIKKSVIVLLTFLILISSTFILPYKKAEALAPLIPVIGGAVASAGAEYVVSQVVARSGLTQKAPTPELRDQLDKNQKKISNYVMSRLPAEQRQELENAVSNKTPNPKKTGWGKIALGGALMGLIGQIAGSYMGEEGMIQYNESYNEFEIQSTIDEFFASSTTRVFDAPSSLIRSMLGISLTPFKRPHPDDPRYNVAGSEFNYKFGAHVGPSEVVTCNGALGSSCDLHEKYSQINNITFQINTARDQITVAISHKREGNWDSMGNISQYIYVTPEDFGSYLLDSDLNNYISLLSEKPEAQVYDSFYNEMQEVQQNDIIEVEVPNPQEVENFDWIGHIETLINTPEVTVPNPLDYEEVTEGGSSPDSPNETEPDYVPLYIPNPNYDPLIEPSIDNPMYIPNSGRDPENDPLSPSDPTAHPNFDPITGTPSGTPNYLNPSNNGALDFSPLLGVGGELTRKFPFSLPWDLKRAIEEIVAPGEKPTWNVAMPVMGQIFEKEITIPEEMEKWVPIFRGTFVFMFMIGLVYATRSLLGGSV